jgi:pimeloyl-ACP methyl ester carboxylesterase
MPSARRSTPPAGQVPDTAERVFGGSGRRILTALLTLVGLVAAAYLAAAAFMYFNQSRMLFPGGGAQGSELPPNAEHLTLRAVDGSLLQGFRVLGAAVPEAGREVILGFGGNAWNAQSAAAYLHDLYPGREVVVFHFRGYPPSGGTASAAALLDDAPLLFDKVQRMFPGRPIVAIGFSIGSGVAAHLAKARTPAGLILVTPFDSLERVASGQVRWLPVRLLLKHRMEAAEDLRGARTPIAIIAARNDRLIPAERTDALRSAAGARLVFDRVIAGSGHNDIYQNPAFHRAMREALTALRQEPEPR